MIKALIVDDEASSRNMLSLLIQKHIPEITELKQSSGGKEAIELIEALKPDLLFLDIEMPSLDGFELLCSLEKRSFNVIFTTAYNEYAIKAIKFSALDYLLKPIDPKELRLAVSKHIASLDRKGQQVELYRNFLHNIETKVEQHFKLAIPTQQGTHFFNTSEIVRCEADSNYTCLVLTDGRKFISSKTLKEYDEILNNKGFIRVHKSHLVNVNFIQKLNNLNQLILKDGSTVEISRRRKDEVLKVLMHK